MKPTHFKLDMISRIAIWVFVISLGTYLILLFVAIFLEFTLHLYAIISLPSLSIFSGVLYLVCRQKEARRRKEREKEEARQREGREKEEARRRHEEREREEARQREEDRKLLILADARRTETLHWTCLNGKDFELEFAALLRKLGYEVKETSIGADRGIDIAAIKDGKKVIVQCKATQIPVSPGVIRDLYGTMISEDADKAILVSISGFSENTREFANGKPIELVDLEQIIKMSVEAQGRPSTS